MEKNTYILNYQGKGIAVIIASNDSELNSKLKEAIQEDLSADKDGEFEMRFENVFDWGVENLIGVSYTQDCCLFNDEFSLTKVVFY